MADEPWAGLLRGRIGRLEFWAGWPWFWMSACRPDWWAGWDIVFNIGFWLWLNVAVGPRTNGRRHGVRFFCITDEDAPQGVVR